MAKKNDGRSLFQQKRRKNGVTIKLLWVSSLWIQTTYLTMYIYIVKIPNIYLLNRLKQRSFLRFRHLVFVMRYFTITVLHRYRMIYVFFSIYVLRHICLPTFTTWSCSPGLTMATATCKIAMHTSFSAIFGEGFGVIHHTRFTNPASSASFTTGFTACWPSATLVLWKCKPLTAFCKKSYIVYNKNEFRLNEPTCYCNSIRVCVGGAFNTTKHKVTCINRIDKKNNRKYLLLQAWV